MKFCQVVCGEGTQTPGGIHGWISRKGEAGPPGGWRKCQEDESPENERHENFYAEIDDFAPSVLTPTGSDSGAGEEDDDGLYQVPTHWPP